MADPTTSLPQGAWDKFFAPDILIPCLIQCALAILAGVYTIEARRQRKQSEAQVLAANKQHFVSTAPYLLVGVITKARMKLQYATDAESMLGQFPPEKWEEARAELGKMLDAPGDFMGVTVTSPTDRLAIHIGAFVYRSSAKHYLRPVQSVELLSRGDHYTIPLQMDPALTREQVLAQIRADYPNVRSIPEELTAASKHSYSIAVFQDIEGAVYAIRRPFHPQEDGDIGMSQSSFFVLS